MKCRYVVKLDCRDGSVNSAREPPYKPRHLENVDDGVRYIDGGHIHVLGVSLRRRRPRPNSLMSNGTRFSYMDGAEPCLVVEGRGIYCKARTIGAVIKYREPIERCLIPCGKYIPDDLIAMPFEMFE